MAAKKTAAPTVADVIGSVEKEAYSNVADTAPEISAQADEPKGVFLPLSVAEKIYEMYNSLDSADAHFHTCQSTNFREHVRSVLKAPKIVKAFQSLKSDIDSVKGGK